MNLGRHRKELRFCGRQVALLLGLVMVAGMLMYATDAWAIAKNITKTNECIRGNYDNQSMNYFVMKCIQARTESFGGNMIVKLQELIAPGLTKICTLAIVLLAIKVALGGTGRKPLGETMILGFKICIVYYCAAQNGAGTLTRHMQDFMSGSADIVTIVFDAGMVSLNAANPTLSICKEPPGSSGIIPDDIKGLPEVAWRFDCLFSRMIGMSGTGSLRLAGAGALMMGTIFAPPFMAAICIAFISLILLYFMAMFQVLLYIVTVHVSLALLFGISPIVIPLWFFEPTKKITIIWFNNVIAYLMLPAIITAYLMMMQIIFLGVGGDRLFGNKTIFSGGGMGWTNCDSEDDTPKPGCMDVFAEFLDVSPTSTRSSGAAADRLKQHIESLVNQVSAGNLFSNLSVLIRDPMALLGRLRFIVSDLATSAQADAGKVYDKTLQAIKNTMAMLSYQATVKGKFVVPFSRPKPERLMEIFALCVANIVLLSLMLSYMRRLITDVDKIISKAGIVPPNVSAVSGAERVVDHATKNLAEISRYGKYI